MRKSWLTIIVLAVVFYSAFLLLSFGWGFLIGAGLTWLGALSSPTPAIIFFLILNHLALVIHVLAGRR